MQSQQHTNNSAPTDNGENVVSPQRHQRHQSLGKSMPVTSLLLNFPPLHRSAYYTRNDRSPEHELPPLYFPIRDSPSPPHPSKVVSTTTPISTSTVQQSVDTIRLEDEDCDGKSENEFEIIVSDCGSSHGDSDDDEGEPKISLIGNSTFYTPCLICTNNAPLDLAQRSTAINEMCRRLCTDECRLRLSLAGFEPSTELPLKSCNALEANVLEMLRDRSSESIQIMGSNDLVPVPALPDSRPPPVIAIQRKKFLMDLLTPSDSDNDSNFVEERDRDRERERENDDRKLDSSELLELVNTSIDDDDEHDDRGEEKGEDNQIDLLKDFREHFEIAEALAKTSAMTSTAQIKQRLAARKLEIELESQLLESIACANKTKSGNASSNELPALAAMAAKSDASTFLTHPDGCGAAYDQQLMYATNDAIAVGGDSAADAQTAMTRSDTLATLKMKGRTFEPPRDWLLYLVRMGSFNSAPKINNIDSQDDALEIPHGLSTIELLRHVSSLRGVQYPPLLSRYFLRPSLTTQLAGSDITDGLRYLQLNSVSRVCSAPASTAPNHMRLLQWNILSQTLGQNNDGFVRCPEEALTWENRKFLIVQEILQQNPDVICLQEVDHFKFLQNILGTQNYEGIFFPKPDSPCLYIEENNGPDGCAIFFKRDKYELKSFETRVLEVWRVQSNQVAIAANLYAKALGREICICTTHLKARHSSLLAKLRNEQGRDLLRFVRNFAGEKRPVILCGDFNAEPIEPVYATILSCDKMKFSSAYADMRDTLMIDDDLPSSDDQVQHDLKQLPTGANKQNFDDSEPCIEKSIRNEPPYTTWKIREDGEECHTIDYVFYAKEQLKVLNCLEFPHGEEIGKNRTPSFQYPSDHFSLVCDFEILEQSKSAAGQPQMQETDPKLKAH